MCLTESNILGFIIVDKEELICQRVMHDVDDFIIRNEPRRFFVYHWRKIFIRLHVLVDRTVDLAWIYKDELEVKLLSYDEHSIYIGEIYFSIIVIRVLHRCHFSFIQPHNMDERSLNTAFEDEYIVNQLPSGTFFLKHFLEYSFPSFAPDFKQELSLVVPLKFYIQDF